MLSALSAQAMESTYDGWRSIRVTWSRENILKLGHGDAGRVSFHRFDVVIVDINIKRLYGDTGITCRQGGVVACARLSSRGITEMCGKIHNRVDSEVSRFRYGCFVGFVAAVARCLGR